MINPIETIRIYNPAGQAYYSDAAKTNIEFPVTNSCERSAKLMGDDYVRLVFKLPNKVVFDTYAFIEYDGQTFFLKETYRPTPNGCLKETIDGKESVSSAYYSYDVKFVSIANMLTKPICYRHVVVKGAGGTQQTWDEPEISINGTLETLYQIIIGSIQQAASRLSASHYKDMLTSIATNGAFTNGAKPNGVQLTPNTKLVTFSFSGDNIANVCTSVANAYTEDGKDTEWYITEDAKHSCTLHFAKCESADTAQVLSDYEWENNGTDRFARPYLNGGLKSVEYAQAWSDVPQVIVPYGADRNMSGISVVGIDETTQMQSTFGKRLRLDPNTTYNVHDKNGENAATITTDAHGAISNPNVNTGIEVTKFYNDIYPQCHFKITKVEVKNKRQSGETVPEYTCEGIAVDARYTKEYLAQKGMFPLRIEEATTLSVRFESGFLNGREFEIANKTHKDQGSTGYSLKFTIVADGSIEDGTLIPSGNFKPNVGDQFALFNMKMPAEFVSLAKQDLAQRAYEELLDLQNTRPEVKCTAEPFTFMQHTVAFGAVVQVSSELFGDKPFVSRIIAYSYKLTSPSNVQFSLASAVMQGTLAEMNNAISDVTHTAGGLEQRAINLSRRGWRDANEVADMLDSITSEMMLVGNERYQFGFTSAIQCVDSNNKFASLRIGYGSLQHTQEPYINYANRGLWEISGATLTKDVNGAALDPNTPYYLFAQVADNTEPARLILTTDAHKSESEDDVPYLLLGILSSEFEDRRVFSRTNGYTAIEGGTITTEQIQDAGRNLIIDFQSNPPRIIARNGAEIIGNIRFKATDTKTAEEQLADLGIIANNAQSSADDALAAANEARCNLFAKKYMLAWNNNSAGTTTLNTDTYGTYYAIAEDRLYYDTAGAANYNDILQSKVAFGASKQYCLKVKWRVASTRDYNGLYLGFKYTDGTRSEWIICAKNQTTPIEAQLISAKDKTVAGVVCTFGTIANTRIYEIQLTEGNKAPSGWIEAEEDKETGGENLYTGANPLTIAARTDNNYYHVKILTGLQNGSKYVFSCGKSVVKAGSTTQYAVLLYDFTNSTSQQQRLLPVGSTRVEQAFTIPSTGTWDLLVYSGVNGSTAGISIEFTDIMVQKGNKATAYQTALSFLGKAIQDMSTDVAGGLLMTGVMMLKDTDNKTVTAGMSGLTTDESGNTDNVLLWGGGTYPEAFYAAQNANYNKSANGNPITTLLKKDGTGKIGIFKISDTQAIVDVPNQGKVIIDASTANGGIFIKDSGGIDRVVVSPLSLDSFGVASTHNLGQASIIKNIYGTEDKDLSGTVSYSKSFVAGKTGTLESSFSIVTEINASVMINSGKGYPSATAGYNTLYVTIKDTTNGTTVFTQSLSTLSVTANANNTTTSNTQDSKYDSKTYSVSVKIQVVKEHNYTLSISGDAVVRGYIGGTPSSSYDAKVQASLSITSDGAIKLLYTDMCAYLCVDGLSVAANSELKFDVMKSGTNLKVLAQGLPTTSSGLSRGQLYSGSDHILRIVN